MKLRILLIVCWVLMSAGSMPGQTGATADPVSGTWKGYMGPGVNPEYAITMDLKLNKEVVSGTLQGLPSPGEVKSGTFDSKTGTVVLQLGITGDSVARLVFEGTVVKGIATGRVSGDNQTGTFMISKVAGESMTTPPAGSSDVAMELRRNFGQVSSWVAAAADLVPAEKYNYRPADTVRTFGQLIGHVADSYNYYCAVAAGQKVEWSEAIEKGTTDKATLVPKLKLALAKCTSVYGVDTGRVRPMMENVAHTNLHYGNLLTYMRMLGMKPPSS